MYVRIASTISFLNFLTVPTSAFGTPSSRRTSSFEKPLESQVDGITVYDDEARDHPKSSHRRSLLHRVASVSIGTFAGSSLQQAFTVAPWQHPPSHGYCYCCGCCSHKHLYSKNMIRLSPQPSPAYALADTITTTTPTFTGQSYSYDKPRNSCLDKFFSYSMSTGMDNYEANAYMGKSRLFDKMLRYVSHSASSSSSSSTASNDVFPGNRRPIIVEIGMGTFPNAPYYARALHGTATNADSTTTNDGAMFKQGLDIISVDPNDYMFDYAIDSANKVGLISPSSLTSLRKVHGVAEALPFENYTIDAVVGTLTLCSVADQQLVLNEIQRVLKPKTGVYLFWEHVLSEKDAGLAFQQRLLSPLQTIVADGCHLNRRTGWNIEHAGFRGGVDMEYMMLDLGVGASIISPTVFGIAYA